MQERKRFPALAKVRPHLNVEIVKRSDRAKGFVVLSKRWIVERTLAWLNRCRRLAKDWENRNGRHDENGSISILDVGRMDNSVKQQA